MNRYDDDGLFTPSPICVAIMNGRRYRLCPSAAGTQARSRATSSSIARTNASSGSSGIASRTADRLNLAAFACGRKATIRPSGWA